MNSNQRVLHICNDFSYSKVYYNLYSKFDDRGFIQYVFHPLRKRENIGKNSIDFSRTESQIFYSDLIQNYHRLFFRSKINFLYRSIRNKVPCEKVNLVNATTLFSDGALAYRLQKELEIPYVVTVRSTDVNIFFKYRPDLIPLGLKILLSANSIIFITPSLRNACLNHRYFKKYKDELFAKSEVIPNGIDDFWLKNIQGSNVSGNKFLYIGRFSKYKNLFTLLNSLKNLKSKYPDIELTIVGGGGDDEKRILDFIRRHHWIRYLGRIYDKERLLTVYRANRFFVMPSIETFGLVYIEALSQGLSLLYSKNQGIDGFFDLPIGQKVNPKNKLDVMNKLEKLINQSININPSTLAIQDFNWEDISNEHIKIIEAIC